MFQVLKDKAVTMALNKVKDKVIEEYLEGIGIVEEIVYRDKKLYLRVRLEGLEQAIWVECSDIVLADDGSWVTVNKFISNMKFVQTALNRFVAGRSFEIPAGTARSAISGAKKVLGL